MRRRPPSPPSRPQDLLPRVAATRRAVEEIPVQGRLHIEFEYKLGRTPLASGAIKVTARGVHFTSPCFIMPLTMLKVRVLLPEASAGGPEQAVDCQGIVVRCIPDRPTEGVDRYEVACFFTDTSPDLLERLGRYLQNDL